MSKAFSHLLKITLYTLGCFLATNDISLAQVTPDNTLDTRVDRNGNVSEITGGSTQGNNLFHSFQDFSVPTGDTASFNNADTIENIFSRVTGGNISNIDGLIRANGSASLFLINPAGIIFGENARLDLGGSFYGSTADSILFEDGEFSASDLENLPLLTINAPIGLGFRDNPGEIVNRANFGLTEQTLEQEIDGQLTTVDRIISITGLEVNPDRNLALIGGNVTFNRSGITAPGGNVTLGGLSQAGTVAISPDGIFTFPENVTKADLTLENNALVSVIGNGGGAIDVDVSNLKLSQQSQLLAGIAEGAGDSNTVAGDITINASDSVTLAGSRKFEDPTIDLETAILNTVGLPPTRVENFNNDNVGNTVGSGGSIAIDTKQLKITKRSVISTRLYGVGNAGDININADTVLLDEGTLTSQVGLDGVKGRGNSGNININTNNFTATNETFVITDNKGTGLGNAGDININAADSVAIQDTKGTRFVSEIGKDAVGNTGDINIVADSLNLENSVQLLTQIEGRGNGGSINLEVAESLAMSGGANIIAQILSGAGEAGNIQINTATLEIIEDSGILIQNQSIGDSGDIIIQADESGLVNNSRIISQIEENGVGNAGDIKITANSLNLENKAELITAIEGEGNTGSIDIEVADSLVLSDRSQIQAQVRSEGTGTAGNIQINTNTLELINDSLVIADSQSQGDSGDIVIRANESLFADDSTISTGTLEDTQGSSGPIEIISPQISLINNTIISSSTQGEGNTGDININTEKISLDNFSLITASSRSNVSGEPGNVTINADLLTLTRGSIINATTSSPDFNGGQIKIDAQILELLSGGVLQTATDSDGNAGDINLNISDGIIVLDGNNAPKRPIEFDFDEDLLNDLEGKTGIFANVNEDTLSSGGNIRIDSDFIIAFPNGNSDIIANARQGQGGTITINAQLLGIDEGNSNRPTNDIDASSDDSDLDGNVVIKSLDTDRIGQPREIPSSVVEVEETTAQVCRTNREAAAKNAFTIEGRGGVRPTPDSPLDSQVLLGDDGTTLGSIEPQPVETSKGKIQLARGIEVTESGVRLTAYRTNNAGERIPERHNCS